MHPLASNLGKVKRCRPHITDIVNEHPVSRAAVGAIQGVLISHGKAEISGLKGAVWVLEEVTGLLAPLAAVPPATTS